MMETKIITTELDEAARLLREGELVAVPTETVYGLAGNGLDELIDALITADQAAKLAENAES